MTTHLVDLEFQKNPSDVLFATACKGAFALCILHLPMKGSIIRSDLHMLVHLDFAIQFVDDVQDVKEDVAEQDTSNATFAVYTSHDLRRRFAGCINFARHGLAIEHPWHKALSFEGGMRKALFESPVLLCIESAVKSSSLREKDRILIMERSAIVPHFPKTRPMEGSLHKFMASLV